MSDWLRTHGVVLVDGSLVLRPFTEDDWGTVAPWNTDPRVLWFSEGDFVEERSVAEVQGIYRGVSQAADVFVIENNGVAVGDGWVQAMNLRRITRAFPGLCTSRIDLQLSHDVWGLGLGTRAIRLMTSHAFGRGDDLVFGVDISDFNERSRRAFLRCGYVPWRRVPSPPGAKTCFVHDLICRPQPYRAHRFVQSPDGEGAPSKGIAPGHFPMPAGSRAAFLRRYRVTYGSGRRESAPALDRS